MDYLKIPSLKAIATTRRIYTNGKMHYYERIEKEDAGRRKSVFC